MTDSTITQSAAPNPWREYAEHLEHCRACAEDSEPCDVSQHLKCTALSATPQAPADPMLRCDIAAHPLEYPLSDYHSAPGNGPLNATWRDKPHRLLYDLIAALKHYTATPPAQEVQASQAVPSDAALRRCLGFFASVIKSGEPWTETCEREYRTALAATPAATPAARPVAQKEQL